MFTAANEIFCLQQFFIFEGYNGVFLLDFQIVAYAEAFCLFATKTFDKIYC